MDTSCYVMWHHDFLFLLFPKQTSFLVCVFSRVFMFFYFILNSLIHVVTILIAYFYPFPQKTEISRCALLFEVEPNPRIGSGNSISALCKIWNGLEWNGEDFY